MSGEETRFLPLEQASVLVGAIQEEEDVEEENRRILMVYSKENKELCWFDFDEVVREVKPDRGDKGRMQVTDYILRRIPEWVLDL